MSIACPCVIFQLEFHHPITCAAVLKIRVDVYNAVRYAKRHESITGYPGSVIQGSAPSIP